MTLRPTAIVLKLLAVALSLAVFASGASALAQPAPSIAPVVPPTRTTRRDRLNPPRVTPPTTAPVVAQPAVPAVPAVAQPPVQVGIPVGSPPPATAPGTGPGQSVRQTPGSLPEFAPGGNMHEFDAGMDFHPLPAGARITFNLQDADLPDLIRAIGNISGRRFIIPGKVRSIKTTIYSPTKVTAGEAYQAFLSVLEVNGMTVVPSGRYLKIVETAGSTGQVLPTYHPGQDSPSEDRYITRIIRLRNISAEDASTVLGHFKSHDGDITPYGATNTLIITDNAANIRRMLQILGDIDVASVGEQIWVEPVHYGLASELATRLTEILTGGAAAAAQRPGAASTAEVRLGRIQADDRSNSLIIVATQRMYLRILELLRRLDVSVEGEGQVRVHRLQHGDAEEMATTLNAIANGGRQAGGQGQNPRGTNAVFEGPVRITADKPSNALVITSSPRDYVALRRVIDELDRSRRQVFIEAVVMELSVNRSNRLGLNFHGALPTDDINQGSAALGGFNALNSILLGQDALSGLALGIRGAPLAGSQNIFPGIGVSIPTFGVTLNALASTGDANVLSTPHIIATDNSPADINVGQNVPLQTNLGGLSSLPTGGATGANPLAALGGLGLSSGFAAPRQDVGTKIRIVPHINDSNEVRLEIDEEISEVGASAGGTLGAVTINRRTAKTVTVVRDQNTVVIGGLIRNADTNTETRIPILGDIPIIGALFRTTSRTVQRSNLLLFLTPYVIRDQGDLRRIFERKMRERQEFLDRYFVFSDQDYEPPRDWTRTNGLVEEIRQSIRDLRTRADLERSSRPRTPPPHTPGESIDLPAEVRAPTTVPSGASAPPSGLTAPPLTPIPALAPPISAPAGTTVPVVGLPVPP